MNGCFMVNSYERNNKVTMFVLSLSIVDRPLCKKGYENTFESSSTKLWFNNWDHWVVYLVIVESWFQIFTLNIVRLISLNAASDQINLESFLGYFFDIIEGSLYVKCLSSGILSLSGCSSSTKRSLNRHSDDRWC